MKTLKSFLYLFKNRLSRNEKKLSINNPKTGIETYTVLIELI